jgi:peptidoglycan/xylan/chitin deacetylase (PgdA/CDA1 family)
VIAKKKRVQVALIAVVVAGAVAIGTGVLLRLTSPDGSTDAAGARWGGTPSVGAEGSPTPSPSATRLPGTSRAGETPPVVNHGPRSGNLVALTFDADMTDWMRENLRTGKVRSYANLPIIDLLEREELAATFFLTGMWIEQYPELTRRLAANPRFELANHTYAHGAFTTDCYDLPHLEQHEMAEDVERTFTLMAEYGGRQTRYFRFPGLCHDATALAALAPLGLTVVDGDVVSGDPFATAWQPIVDAVLSQVQPGSVIIMHVTEANAAMTDDALPHILAGLRERGLTPAPLSEVLGDT